MTQKEKINTEELGEKIVKVIKTIFDRYDTKRKNKYRRVRRENC